MSGPGNLITPEAREWIGRRLDFGPEAVTERDVLRYLVATSAPLPEPGVEPRVPLFFYRTIGRRIAPVEQVREDGLWPGLRPHIGVGQVMVGGIDVLSERDLLVGDVLSGYRVLESLVEKRGRRRDFVLASWTTVINDAAGLEVVRERVTEIMY